MPMIRPALSFVLLASPIAALAQDDVGSAAWLSGCWVASASDVRSEEVWMEPEGGLMVGMARTLRGGVATGYEFLLLQLKDGRLTCAVHDGLRDVSAETCVPLCRDLAAVDRDKRSGSRETTRGGPRRNRP